MTSHYGTDDGAGSLHEGHRETCTHPDCSGFTDLLAIAREQSGYDRGILQLGWPELPPPPEGASGWDIYDVTDPGRPEFLQSTGERRLVCKSCGNRIDTQSWTQCCGSPA